MSKKGSAPTAPDFTKAATSNASNPFGTQTWTPGADGRYTLSSQFSGPMQDVWGGLLGGMKSASTFNPATAGDSARDSMYGFLKGRLDPQWDQNRTAFNASMVNQGLDPGQQAFDNASRNFGQQENDAYAKAGADSLVLGQQEQAQARANAALPFQLGGGLFSGLMNQGNTMAPFLGAKTQYDAQKDQASAENSKKGSALGGLGSIAGMAFGGPVGGLLGGAAGNMLGQTTGGLDTDQLFSGAGLGGGNGLLGGMTLNYGGV